MNVHPIPYANVTGFVTTGKLQVATLKREALGSGEYFQKLAESAIATAICINNHSVDQRLANWILTHAADDKLHMTQLFISQFLGVRREGVTVAAGKLQKCGAINYLRGNINILDRAKLAASACGCEVVR